MMMMSSPRESPEPSAAPIQVVPKLKMTMVSLSHFADMKATGEGASDAPPSSSRRTTADQGKSRTNTPRGDPCTRPPNGTCTPDLLTQHLKQRAAPLEQQLGQQAAPLAPCKTKAPARSWMSWGQGPQQQPEQPPHACRGQQGQGGDELARLREENAQLRQRNTLVEQENDDLQQGRDRQAQRVQYLIQENNHLQGEVEAYHSQVAVLLRQQAHVPVLVAGLEDEVSQLKGQLEVYQHAGLARGVSQAVGDVAQQQTEAQAQQPPAVWVAAGEAGQSETHQQQPTLNAAVSHQALANKTRSVRGGKVHKVLSRTRNVQYVNCTFILNPPPQAVAPPTETVVPAPTKETVVPKTWLSVAVPLVIKAAQSLAPKLWYKHHKEIKEKVAGRSPLLAAALAFLPTKAEREEREERGVQSPPPWFQLQAQLGAHQFKWSCCASSAEESLQQGRAQQ